MKPVDEINQLMKDVFALQEEQKSLGFFQFGKAGEIQGKLKEKQERYTQLVKENMDELELHRTCKRCSKEWYAQPRDLLGLRNRAVANTVLGATTGAYAQAAGNQERIGAAMQDMNACPECKSTKFEEVWA